MPQPFLSPPSEKRSENGPSSGGIAPEEDPIQGRPSGIFTAEPAAPPPSERALAGNAAEEATPQKATLQKAASQKELFRKKAQRATDPFPEGLFRMPVPDRLFSEMKTMSDSALRALLGLIRLSFRFAPKTGQWVRPERSFRRSDIENECGLSSQGTREGLKELAEAGWVFVDSSGRAHEYQLLADVPEERYTYLPTRFLEEAGALTGTELRLVLAVLRGTWGWTCPSGEPDQDDGSPEHRRWARLSVGTLSKLTGRSETAIKKAARSLSGRYLRRRRPTGGAYYYRFLPGGLTETGGSKETAGPKEPAQSGSFEYSGRKAIEVKKRARCARSLRPAPGDTSPGRGSCSSVSRGIANNPAPHRQQSDPPQSNIESFSEREAQHRARETSSGEGANPRAGEPETNPSDAMPGKTTSSPPVKTNASPQKRSSRSSSRRARAGRSSSGGEIDLDRFSDRLQKLGKALMNVGVRPRATAQLLSRHSPERIRANFDLYRQRAAEIRRPGAWLYVAIRDGYALPRPEAGDWGEKSIPEADSGDSSGEKRGPGSPSSLPEPGTKVSETRKRELIARGMATDADFEKFADYDDEPDRKQHFFQLEKR